MVGEGVGVNPGDEERDLPLKAFESSGVEAPGSVSFPPSSSVSDSWSSASSELSPSSSYSGPLW